MTQSLFVRFASTALLLAAAPISEASGVTISRRFYFAVIKRLEWARKRHRSCHEAGVDFAAAHSCLTCRPVATIMT